ncbi:MAG: demethoxyubiquinone hydroxylase family protein [Maricaulaceae bacterium]|jgi:ubiquinone biosynthesis monooxygenase Coq7
MPDKRRPRPRPPGDGLKRRVEEMLRVDHAGEYGAVAIYRGQQAVLARARKTRGTARTLNEMEREEQRHLEAFDTLLNERQVRPTALAPVWNAAGFALGAATALLGERAAHACTEAVETVIEQHYQSQVDELEAAGEEPELAKTFAEFRAEELNHRDEAVNLGAKDAPGYPLLAAFIRAGCRAAIKVSEKV